MAAAKQADALVELDAPTNMDAWLRVDSLREHTMETEIVLFSQRELRAFCKVAEALAVEDVELSDVEKALDGPNRTRDVEMGSKELARSGRECERDLRDAMTELRSISSRLEDAIIERKLDEGKGVFAKMTTRSAKDCVYDDFSAKVKKNWKSLLSRFPKSKSMSAEQYAVNTFIEATSTAFSYRDTKTLLLKFLQSSRVNFDTNRAVEYNHGRQNDKDRKKSEPVPGRIGIVIRKFTPISPETEFRVFVKDRRITAISQYFHHCFYPSLQGKESFIAETILRFFEDIISPVLPKTSSEKSEMSSTPPVVHLACSSFILDLIVNFAGKVQIIELNPFIPSTSGCLFDWAKDRMILENTFPERAPEVRIVKKNLVGSLAYLVPCWRREAKEWLDSLQI